MTIKEIQQFLNSAGYLGANGKPLSVDGISGTNTVYAIKAYQASNGLTVDGIVGPKTTAKMQGTSSSTGSNSGISNTTTNNTSTTSSGPLVNPPGALFDRNTGQPISPSTSGINENYNKSGDTPSSYYGYEQKRNSDAENQSALEEGGIEKAMTSSGIINSNFMNTITSDPSIMAFYINALTYGGYTIGDIVNDMKRRELIAQGGTNAESLQSLKIIDPTVDRSTYTTSADGQKATSQTASLIPTFNFQGLINPDILKYGSNMPDDLFKILVPIADPNSQEFKDAVAKVKATYFDLATAQLQATTEQAKAVADYNMQQFTDQINKQYGIALSDDATKAWAQIENIENTYNTRGIAGSGLENQAIDESLAATRKADQRLRDTKLTTEEQNKASYYRSSASAAEISALTPEERVKYGLTPSADIVDQFSIANLKAKNPTWTDQMVQQAHDAMIDENGNYRSTLYSTYYNNIATTGQNQQATAISAVQQDALNKENTAYTNTIGDTTGSDPLKPTSNSTITDPAPVTTPPITPPPAASTAPTTSSSIINIDSNPGQKLQPGQVYTYKGQTYTQPGAAPTQTYTPPANTYTAPTQTYTPPAPTYTAPTPTYTAPKSTTPAPVNIDSNPGQRLSSGTVYTYQGKTYTQP